MAAHNVTTFIIMGLVSSLVLADATPSEPGKPAPDVQSLLRAAKEGDLEQVNKAIASGVDVNATLSKRRGWTALHAAAEWSQTEVLKRLIEAGAEVNARDHFDVTPLHRAATRGPLESVVALLNAKADPNISSRQYGSPLGQATATGQPKIARALIDAGADVNGGKSMTPLMLAAKNAQVEMIGLLVESGAKLDGQKRPPLHWAGKPEVAKALLAAGADVNVRDSEGRTALHLTTGYWVPNSATVKVLIAAGADVNAKSKDGVTPLHAALRHQVLEIIELLIAAGADVDAMDDAGHTPLSLARKAGKPFVDALAAAAAKDDGMTELLRAVEKEDGQTVAHFIAEGADVTALGPGGMSAVHLASKLGNMDILDSLIAAGAQVDVHDENGVTPLHLAPSGPVAERLIAAGAKVNVSARHATPMYTAISQGRVDVVQVLIKHGALKNTEGQGLLIWGAFFGRADVVEVLLKNGVKAGSKIGFCGESALDVVARGGLADMPCPDHVTEDVQLNIARQLIAAGADVNATTDVGYFVGSTALHGAASSGHLDIVRLLLDSGAKVNARSPKGSYAGYTPLHGAARGGHVEVIGLLLKGGAEVNAVTGESYFGGKQTPVDLARTAEARTLLRKHGGRAVTELDQ